MTPIVNDHRHIVWNFCSQIQNSCKSITLPKFMMYIVTFQKPKYAYTTKRLIKNRCLCAPINVQMWARNLTLRTELNWKIKIAVVLWSGYEHDIKVLINLRYPIQFVLFACFEIIRKDDVHCCGDRKPHEVWGVEKEAQVQVSFPDLPPVTIPNHKQQC